MKSGTARATDRLERDVYARIIPRLNNPMIAQRTGDAARRTGSEAVAALTIWF
jgi:hypothetical protein